MVNIKIFFVILFFVININAQASENQNSTVELSERQKRLLKTLILQQNDKKVDQQKIIYAKIEKLTDGLGQIYIGVIVNKSDLVTYLNALKDVLKDDYNDFRGYQAARDKHSFHITLLTPKEYQLANQSLINNLISSDINNKISITLLGLGKVKQEAKQTYFIVAQSSDGQSIRQRLLLKNKDFHLTLAFNKFDIYGVKKDKTTLITYL